MKKQFFFLIVLAFSLFSSAQPTTPGTPAVKTDYLKKSKNQKTVAWILLGGGIGLTSAGFAVGLNEAVNDLSNIFSVEEQKSSNTGEFLFYTGLASMAASIPFFIASSGNKRKAATVSTSLKIETRSYLQQSSISNKLYPSINLKVAL